MFLIIKFSVSTKLCNRNDLAENMTYFWNKLDKNPALAANQFSTNTFICQLCGKIIISSAIKCAKCYCYLHTKCFDKAAEIFDIHKSNWMCRKCYYKDARNFELQTIVNHNECLRDQVKLLTKLVSDQDYINCLQKQRLQELENFVSCIFNFMTLLCCFSNF